MSKIVENNVCILMIDIQEKLLNSVFNKDVLSKKAEIILNSAKILNIPVIVSEQYPRGLGNTVDKLQPYIDSSNVFDKVTFSVLDTKSIENKITELAKKQIIVFGIETHICVYQSIQDLLEEGYEIFLINDASGSRSEKEHIAGIDRLKTLGCNILTTEMFIFELLKSSKHEHFKEIQALIK